MNKEKLYKLAKMVLKFRELETDKGILVIEDELAPGVEINKEDGTAAEDGEYLLGETKITVKEGKVESIEEPREEEEQVEEVVEESSEEVADENTAEEDVPSEPDERDLKIQELERLVAEKDEEISRLNAEIEQLKATIEKPVEEPVEMSAQVQEVKKEAKGAMRYFMD